MSNNIKKEMRLEFDREHRVYPQRPTTTKPKSNNVVVSTKRTPIKLPRGEK